MASSVVSAKSNPRGDCNPTRGDPCDPAVELPCQGDTHTVWICHNRTPTADNSALGRWAYFVCADETAGTSNGIGYCGPLP
jgi:hypothetical protein